MLLQRGKSQHQKAASASATGEPRDFWQVPSTPWISISHQRHMKFEFWNMGICQLSWSALCISITSQPSTPKLALYPKPYHKEGEKQAGRHICFIPNLNPKKKEKSFTLMNFRSFFLSWSSPVLASLRYHWAHCLQFGTWLSFAKDTKLASCMENCVQFRKVERERVIWIYSQLSTAFSTTLSQWHSC